MIDNENEKGRQQKRKFPQEHQQAMSLLRQLGYRFCPLSSKPKLSTKSYLDLVNICLDTIEGHGSLSNGGLGIAVYLRMRLSDLETHPTKAEKYLEVALKYAIQAFDDSKFYDGRTHYLSIMSGDAVGSVCLLVSVICRLRRGRETKKSLR